MTRKEAIRKINTLSTFDIANDAPRWLIDSLERLGVIKFEEDKPEPEIIIEGHQQYKG